MLVPLAHHTHMAMYFIPPYLHAYITQNSEHHSYSHAHIIQTTCSQSCSLHSQSCSYYSDHHTHSHVPILKMVQLRVPYWHAPLAFLYVTHDKLQPTFLFSFRCRVINRTCSSSRLQFKSRMPRSGKFEQKTGKECKHSSGFQREMQA